VSWSFGGFAVVREVAFDVVEAADHLGGDAFFFRRRGRCGVEEGGHIVVEGDVFGVREEEVVEVEVIPALFGLRGRRLGVAADDDLAWGAGLGVEDGGGELDVRGRCALVVGGVERFGVAKLRDDLLGDGGVSGRDGVKGGGPEGVIGGEDGLKEGDEGGDIGGGGLGDDLRPEREGVLGEEPAAEGARDDELVGGGEAADEVEDVAGGAQARERGGGGVAGEGLDLRGAFEEVF
jgi:hypothetical protein